MDLRFILADLGGIKDTKALIDHASSRYMRVTAPVEAVATARGSGIDHTPVDLDRHMASVTRPPCFALQRFALWAV